MFSRCTSPLNCFLAILTQEHRQRVKLRLHPHAFVFHSLHFRMNTHGKQKSCYWVIRTIDLVIALISYVVLLPSLVDSPPVSEENPHQRIFHLSAQPKSSLLDQLARRSRRSIVDGPSSDQDVHLRN